MEPKLNQKASRHGDERRNGHSAQAGIKESVSVESHQFKALEKSKDSALKSWFAGLTIGVGLPAFVALVSVRAMEISRNEAATNALELIVFIGASALLVTHKGSHNFRLTTEIVVWLATANMLAFKYLPFAGAVTAAAVASIVSLFFAYRRGKG